MGITLILDDHLSSGGATLDMGQVMGYSVVLWICPGLVLRFWTWGGLRLNRDSVTCP